MGTAEQFADVSSNNGVVDLAAYARAGHRLIMAKTTEGTGYRWYGGDSLHERAHELGLAVGRYGWIRPDESARAQADYFVAAVRPLLRPGDVLMGDFEATADARDPGDAARAQQLRTWATRVGNQLHGHDLWIYTGNWYLAGKPHVQAECRRWPVVMSDYSGAAELPNEYRLNYVAWQFTDRARVAGVPGECDYNRLLPTTGTDSLTARKLRRPHTMYSLYRDRTTGHWYVGAAGYWAACTTKRDVLVAIADPQCTNRAQVARATQGPGTKKARATALATFNFPPKTLADMRARLLAIGGAK